VPREAWVKAYRGLPLRQRDALTLACRHLGLVCRRELAALRDASLRPLAGLTVHLRWVPVPAVTLIVPLQGVTALLAAAIPAAVAGVAQRVALVTPGGPDPLPPALLAAAYMADLTELRAVDRAAVAPLVDAHDPSNPVLELGAAGAPGPLVVLADGTAPVEFLAGDLLAEALASAPTPPCLVTTSPAVAEALATALRSLGRRLPRDRPGRRILPTPRVEVVADLTAAAAAVNRLAPGRTLVLVQRPEDVLERLTGGGAILVGPYSAPVLDGRITGVGAGGLGVATFLRRMTVQEVEPSGYGRLARAAAVLLEMDGLAGAADALAVRVAPLREPADPEPAPRRTSRGQK
jgi:histidinol dehydrogenase